MSHLIDLDEFLRQNCVDRMDGKTCEECKHHVLEVSCERLMKQPTADPVKHGRWEKLDLWTKPVCSVCGDPCFGLHGFSYETTAYCPNCGARMDGEEG